ncbi:MAG: glycine cleavage system protein GcvH [Treponema sp.]|jgi:glycine cleavage system H protein|nr:glycine cleavage system protein GcvH [Treponema sp.]
MYIPEDLRYTKTHEWIREVEDGVYEIGLTDFAQKELGDIVFVNLPQAGEALAAGASFADVESVKAVSEIYSPLDGEVAEVNQTPLDEPELINKAPYETWLVKARGTSSPDALLSASEYKRLIG